ncbi:MAG TPA: class I SAM-dependent methyltransferase [Candidatus Bathyarchaeia archaeon]|nr:class I SAM-dependent methyltransferase [Candidatus Bathyarchaeia archaeon]
MAKKSSSEFESFRSVDQASQPEKFVEYLDLVTGIEAIQAYKTRSYDLLHLRPGHHVLDVGCGTGDDVRAMAGKVGPSGRAVGVDSSETMIAEAKKRARNHGSNIEFYTGNALSLSFNDNTFDASRSERTFQHLTEPMKALHEMVRVTKPSGRVGVLDPDWETVIVDSSNNHLTRRILTSFKDGHANPTSGRRLYSQFHTAKLQNLEVLPITIPILSFKLAESVLGIRNAVDKAIEKNSITMEEGDKWLRELEERERNGQFFSSMTGFGVFGTKI